jgi:ribonucleoside-triphosphate reductase
MKTLEQLDHEIKEIQARISQVKGRETEVYTRIVGYHRAVSNWNIGKKEEFYDRVVFKFDESKKTGLKNEPIFIDQNETVYSASSRQPVVSYKLFWSNFCRNCPPVKEFAKSLNIQGDWIDVSTDFGLSSAREYQIMSTPTIVFLDRDGNEVGRGSDVDQLKEMMNSEKNLIAV